MTTSVDTNSNSQTDIKQDVSNLVEVKVSPDNGAKTGQTAGDNGQSRMDIKAAFLKALMESPLPVSKRSKASPVSDALDEIKDLLIDLKMGTNGHTKSPINYINKVVNASGIKCSVASLNKWFADNDAVVKRKDKI
jgi:hypothetical protein